jgi:FAD/FMN-containing dehydrogenase
MMVNFGGNVRFAPPHVYAPTTEAEVLEILDRHAHGKVRVVGALHAWSPAVVCQDAIVDMRRFNSVRVERKADGDSWATVGGGCPIKHLLRKLHRLGEVTLPSIGLITEQTIAGAVSTATHGSGKHSLSHYIDELRVAAYDPVTGKACIYTWNDGPELRAARCALGCVGIILSVRIRCVPRYEVAECMVPCATLEDVLAAESKFPLQQFYLAPHRWTYFAQRRQVTAGFRPSRRWTARLFRVWWFFSIDVGLHVVIKVLNALPKSSAWVRFFFRHVLPRLILTNTTVVDHGERMLVMAHELFKHLEIEIFVSARRLDEAMTFVRVVLEMFDGAMALPDVPIGTALKQIGMYDELLQLHGTFTHHYPIALRRVLPDDALISMSCGNEVWYAISFITYREPRQPFLAMASFLARGMSRLFEARLHWGKYFPLTHVEVDASYLRLPEFRGLCRQVDPRGVFRNEFAERVLFAQNGHTA